jgi:hypothetical protein
LKILAHKFDGNLRTICDSWYNLLDETLPKKKGEE